MNRVKKRIVIWGASGHALVVADIVRLVGEYEIYGFLDDTVGVRPGTKFAGSVVLGGKEQLPVLSLDGIKHIILAFGDCAARVNHARRIRKLGFHLATAIHPKACIAEDCRIGEGSVIAAGAVVNSGTDIGANAIINTCASVDHECHLEEGVHVCPGSHLAGRVFVGVASWIGIGSTVIEEISIGRNVFIGAGAVVTKNLPANVVAYGVPARIVKQNVHTHYEPFTARK